jgi:putative nucleotidyltransferase with HDIG domain
MKSVFFNIRVSAKEIRQDACIIGRYVLSPLIKRNIYQNIDIFTEGSGILLAQKVSKKFYHLHNTIITCFRRFDTAKIKTNGKQIEFIGDSNQINISDTIAISLNANNYGFLIETLITLNKNILNFMRYNRVSVEFLAPEQIAFYYLFEQRERIKMFSIEVIINDFNKIILSHNPSVSLFLLDEIGLLSILLPEITYLKELEEKEGSSHKNNFYHTCEVLENVSDESNSLWLRWAALLHDIGKSITKKYITGIGWTFHAHEYIGARLIPYLFHRLKFPMSCIVRYVQKVLQYSSRPISLICYEATDSAIRRLLFYVGENIDDLLRLCKADITTKNIEKKLSYINYFLLVERKLKKLDLKDRCRKCPISICGNEIMIFFQLNSSPQIGIIKKAIKEAILDGKLDNDFSSVYSFIIKKGRKLGFQ